MSRVLRDMVIDLRGIVTGNRKTVLSVLADRADDPAGYCWPGIPYIAERAGCSRSTVFRCLNDLEDLKLITRVPQTLNGEQTTNDYFVEVGVLVDLIAKQRMLRPAEVRWLKTRSDRPATERPRPTSPMPLKLIKTGCQNDTADGVSKCDTSPLTTCSSELRKDTTASRSSTAAAPPADAGDLPSASDAAVVNTHWSATADLRGVRGDSPPEYPEQNQGRLDEQGIDQSRVGQSTTGSQQTEKGNKPTGLVPDLRTEGGRARGVGLDGKPWVSHPDPWHALRSSERRRDVESGVGVEADGVDGATWPTAAETAAAA